METISELAPFRSGFNIVVRVIQVGSSVREDIHSLFLKVEAVVQTMDDTEQSQEVAQILVADLSGSMFMLARNGGSAACI